MEEQNFKNNPANQDYLFAYALKLYKSSENKDLEKLFSKFLKKSYDSRFWNLYIEYVNKVSTKKVNLIDVYAFVVNHFDCSYISYDYVSGYVRELINSDEENSKIDLIRKIYHKSMVPMHNLGLLWSEYEKWENKVNKLTAKSFIDQIQPIYNVSFNTYQRLLPFIETNQFFKIFDIELENPLKLQKKNLDLRLNFLFSFYINKFPTSTPLLFLYSFYLKDFAKEVLMRESPNKDTIPQDKIESLNSFLSIWYSFLYNKEFFNFEDIRNKDLVLINYLNWILKNQGMEAFRRKFLEKKALASAHVFIYAAKAEFHQGGNKEGCYQIFMEAFEKFKGDSLVNEQFFKMFLNIGDDDNIRRLFKKLSRTEVMWDLMIEYEFLYGDLEAYKTLLIQKQEELNNKENLPPAPTVQLKIKNKGTQGVYESAFKSFGFLDLQINTNDLLSDFISKLPELGWNENILSNLDNQNVVDLLASLGK